MSTHTSALPPADLASAFAAGSRAAGLAGLSRRRPPASPRPSASPDTAPAGPGDSGPAPRVKSRHQGPATPAAEEPPRQITVYVPLETRDLLVAERDTSRARREPKTTTGIVLAAVEAALPTLERLLIDPPPEPNPGLFSHRDTRPTTPNVQLGMRLNPADLRILDDLAKRHHTNRSRLVAAALAHRYARTTTERTAR